MYRTQRMWQHVSAQGQRRIALALVAALAFTVGAAFGAYGSRVYSVLTATRQVARPAGTSPVADHRAAPAQVVGPEDIVTLPAQIQEQVRRARGPRAGNANAAARAQVLGPEDIATLPPQIQDQVRGMPPARASGKTAAREHALSGEDILTLPPQIQAQVRQATQGRAADNATGAGEQGLGPVILIALWRAIGS
ncbi:MAG: hypothetical protein M3380_00935, partial [Chloroflexota bacterium]|nr:hypothetical protein [Chloroflexota bacterium]